MVADSCERRNPVYPADKAARQTAEMLPVQPCQGEGDAVVQIYRKESGVLSGEHQC